MNRKTSYIIGGGLILLGLLGIVGAVTGISFHWWQVWRIWPIAVIGIGLLFVVPPVLNAERKGLWYLFIPGTPILTIGAMLLIGSLFNAWVVWAYWWPALFLSIGFGFFMAALFAKNIYLVIPGFIFFLNGVVFQFSALTGYWDAWAVLWAIEPLSIGLGLLTVGLKRQSKGTITAALILCGFASFAFVGMTALTYSGSWMFRYGVPVVIIAAGAVLLYTGFRNKSSDSDDDNSSGGELEVLEEAVA